MADVASVDPCGACNRRVYEMEKVAANSKLYHKFCFRCNICKGILRMDNFAVHKGELYCKTHYKQVWRG